ncbi:pentatricopeptide repeat-containing protein At4g35130, chloroplastic isoform X1 [Dioscorea cayenensis subsp. rotundata]|uniref:Pentatricopeptide repeat-containing protein At4g35130, chloroplastic isoform X1 n=2 Tax=Dioscorea cayennensis subsp. rotundata TaxID=55577 RepID=A0AB40CDI1_DIOCR|nr:pentatricopeptide repeat-containing protein At4g35130, chloroplastic isoform X1 [Dioscorea cayenensis subsp. rotundata]
MATCILQHLCNSPSKLPQTISSSTSLQSKRQNSLLARPISFFTNSGQMDQALSLFSTATKPDTFLWNTMIRGFTDIGLFSEAIDFYHAMQAMNTKPDHFTFPFVLKSCAALSCYSEGVKVHAILFKLGFDADVFIFLSFQEMQLVHGMKPDEFGIMNALEVVCCLDKCAGGRQGKSVHCFAMKNGLDSDIKVQSSVLDMYCKFGNLLYAERCFRMIHNPNVVAWNALIGGYVMNEQADKALSCLRKMQVDLIDVDAVTLVNLLPCCANNEKEIHGLAIRRSFLPHLVLETALIDMYAKCGSLRQAEFLFKSMDARSLVSWNTMIATYVQNCKYTEALELFLQLLKGALDPDPFTFSSIIPAYAELASLRHGMQIHALSIKLGFGGNVVVSNSITHLYAKCGDIWTSRKAFDKIECKDIVSWNTLIMCYGIHGQGKTALDLFSRMKEYGFQPNESTFVSVLRACSISGLVDEAWKHFKSMEQQYGINPQIEHYCCMVDILGRSGDLKTAIDFIDGMPMTPTARLWGSLLTASRNNNNIEVAEYAVKHIFELNHDNTGCYVLLASLYADAGRLKDVEDLTRLMKEQGIQRITARSMVELISKTCSFVDGDKTHKESYLIHKVFDILQSQISASEGSLRRRHSVRLAVSFGLISSSVGMPILVKKNVRVCNECHSAMKVISKFSRREIIVGDSKIYHHFSNGICSCGDYW